MRSLLDVANDYIHAPADRRSKQPCGLGGDDTRLEDDWRFKFRNGINLEAERDYAVTRKQTQSGCIQNCA